MATRKLLFRCDRHCYYIFKDIALMETSIHDSVIFNVNLNNVTHMKSLSPLYYVRYSNLLNLYSVYYEYNDYGIIGSGGDFFIWKLEDLTRDYTLDNINILKEMQ